MLFTTLLKRLLHTEVRHVPLLLAIYLSFLGLT